MVTVDCRRCLSAVWGLVALGLLLSGPSEAQAQGWPALEDAQFKAVGGGQNDAAVLIGIDDYYELPKVVGAEANVRAWERWLRSGRGVPVENIALLTGRVNKDQARAAVEDAASRVGANGTLYFVFVGHGGPAKVAQNYEAHLLMADTYRDVDSFGQRGVAVDSELSRWLQPASAKGAQVVTVLDACFTGKAQGGGELVTGAQFAAFSSMAAPVAQTVLSATSSNDITGPLPGASRPAFSYLVLGALLGWGDRDGNGTVTASEAVAFAAGVMRDAQRKEKPQYKGKDLVLAKNGKSGGQAAPPYQDWVRRSAAVVSTPLVATLPSSDLDLATLAREAQAADQRAEAARKQLAEGEARRLAEQARLLAEAQTAWNAQAHADFQTIRAFVERPTEAGRRVLEGFVAKYGAGSVTIDGVQYPLSVPELAQVQAALGSRTGSDGGPGGGGSAGEVDRRTGIEWVQIPGGSFQMGSPASEPGRHSDEVQRKVSVGRFEMAKTEVTVRQYAACVRAGACSAPNSDVGTCNWEKPGRDGHPVNCVDWAQASAFAVWAGGRLPSEAEWEYAARGATTGPVYNEEMRYAVLGKNNAPVLHDIAVYGGNSGVTYDGGYDCSDWPEKQHSSSRCGTHAVGTKRANRYGLQDMLGNVWEWVADWYGPYDEAPTDGTERSGAAKVRVNRGGGWYGIAGNLRAAVRGQSTPGYRSNLLGFRLAR